MKAVKLAALAALVMLGPPRAAAAQALGINVTVQDVQLSNPTLRIGQSYTLKEGEGARQVVVIAGDATLEGRVDRDVVVIFGKVQLASTAVIDGSLVVVGGNAVAAAGAQVHQDLVVIGGFDGAPGFTPGGQHIVIGTTGIGEWFRAGVPWLTHGLLLGRPIVPWLPWVWLVAGVFFLVNLLLNVVFDAPVRAATASLRATPLTTFMTGILVMLLAGPLCFVLAVSLIGIAVIPFLICALLLAALLGKVAFARWIGMSVRRQDDLEDRGQSFRSFFIGSAIMCLAYMVPILGLVTWSMAGVFGLGASTLAFFSAYRREHPKKPKPPKVAAPIASDLPLVVPAAQVDGASPAEPPEVLVVPPAQAEAAVPPSAAEAVMLPRAPFIDRLGALALDAILVFILIQAFRLDDREGAGLLVALAYHIGFWTWKSTTVGGIICQLRVIRVDGAPLQFAEALVRGLTGIFSLAVLGLGFLWILRDPERQGWHDRVAGTYVVKVPRNWPI